MNEDRNNKQRDTLVTWLKDAYAMEEGIVEILERQIEHFDGMPDAQEKIREHLELTRTQADRVQECVESLGDDVSKVKAGLANFLGAAQGMSTMMANDKMVKDAMACYAIEHFEIASYLAIMTAAREMGHEEIAQVCEMIAVEEQEMASWLEMQLPMVVEQHFLSEVYMEER